MEEILTAQVSHRLGKTKIFTGRVLDGHERHNFFKGSGPSQVGGLSFFYVIFSMKDIQKQ